jgi:NitT/TauT family transport system permease protein/sulfonate transport system permease protein
LGIGNASSYFIVFIGSFFPIFTNVYFGTSSIPQIYKNVAKNYELKKWEYYRYILLNFSLPFIFTGLKIGIGMAWMSVIAAELISSQSGLGYYIQINRLLLRTDRVIIGMALIGVIGLFLQMIIKASEKRIVKWGDYD